MRKRIFKIIPLVLAVMLSFSFLTGCVSPEAEKFTPTLGVTLLPYSDGTDYYADFIIVVPQNKIIAKIEKLDEYLLSVFNLYSTAERSLKPAEMTVDGENCYSFAYKCTVPKDIWFISGSPDINYGLFNIEIDYSLLNPFEINFQRTFISEIYSTFSFHLYKYVTDFDINADEYKTVLLSTKRTAKTDSGGIVFDVGTQTHYYRQHGTEPLEFSYTVMASYGYFAIALILGVAVVVLILLLAKKKEGRTVDLTASATKVDAYPQYINVDPFGLNDDNDNNPNSSGSGGVFDGF